MGDESAHSDSLWDFLSVLVNFCVAIIAGITAFLITLAVCINVNGGFEWFYIAVSGVAGLMVYLAVSNARTSRDVDG